MYKLTKEKETLLIPLYGKAKEYKSKNAILNDIYAFNIVQKLDYDFSSLKIQDKTNIMMCIRAKLIDDELLSYLNENDKLLVLHLGCGLDCRYKRINALSANWYDVDFEDVIEIRRMFDKESERYHLVGTSVTEKEWTEKLPTDSKETLVIAEGLTMYLKEPEIKTLISRLYKRLGKFRIIFDAYSRLTAKQAGKHPSIKRTGATIHWGLDNPESLETWQKGIKFIKAIYFSDNKYINRLSFGTKLMFKIANCFKIAKNAHRILIYDIG